MKTSLRALCVLVGILAVACGQQSGFQSKSSSSFNSTSPEAGTPPDSFSDADLWNQINEDLTARMKGTQESTVLAVDQSQEALILLFPFQPLTVIAGKFVSEEYPDIKVEKVQRDSGEPALALIIPFRYVFGKNAKMQAMDKLPNGDPLPAFPAGEIRGFSIRLGQTSSKFRMNVYIGPQAVAAFIETPGLDLPGFFDWMDPVPVYNKSRNMIVGYYKLVAEKGSFPGGFYVAARIPKDTALKIQRVVKF